MTEFESYRANLEVADLEPTVEFLRDVLGFVVEVDEPGMGLALVRRDGVGLGIVRTENPAVNETTAGYVGVSDVDALHEHCVLREVDIVMPLTEHPWGLRDFVLRIPGGHRLAFGQRIG
ncbi:VOC family protein [Nocardia sp. CDC153]|uniref:VOC family protein n=1 Tax=Nocardia sp. CDC153 TaxID=3112167 RepID=UPI002DB5AE41|nr:VOC family protein [Nocardia sp. CDC153]MEC3954018.1 VOC family protein [Nocardia sp. CDC153]